MPSAGYSQPSVSQQRATTTLPSQLGGGPLVPSWEKMLGSAAGGGGPCCPNSFVPWFYQSRGTGLSVDKLVATLQEDGSLKPLQSAMSHPLMLLARTSEKKIDL